MFWIKNGNENENYKIRKRIGRGGRTIIDRIRHPESRFPSPISSEEAENLQNPASLKNEIDEIFHNVEELTECPK